MDQDSSHKPRPAPLPQGYRQGIIGSATVLLGFSLALFRFWSFEAPGEWTLRSILAAATMVLAVAMQIVALGRSLRLQDDDPSEYRQTVFWLTSSVVVMLVGLLFATVILAHTPEAK
ncbi:MAG TPA: hypothetical protein VGO79_03215 [Thermoanaerobaculia bacterium]|jgi:hypothetical protein